MASHSSLSLWEQHRKGHHPLPKQEAPSKEDHVSAQASEEEGSQVDGKPSPEQLSSKLWNIQYPKCAHGPRRWTKLSRDEVLTLSITTPRLWPKAAGQDTGDHCSHHLRGGLLCSPKSNSASKPKRDPMLASQCQAVLSMWMEVICVSFIIKTSCFLLAGL